VARVIVLSWNLRTFGHHPTDAEVLDKTADIILSTAADIVCIQEIQVGEDSERTIDGAIGVNPKMGLLMLCLKLRRKDEGAFWDYSFTGPNSGPAGHMRDAYAFFWRRHPSAAKASHEDPCDEIYAVSPSQVLRSGDSFWKSGRRPGQLVLNIRTRGISLPVQLISFHAATKDYVKPALRLLPKIPEIGGFSDGIRPAVPLPYLDTLVVGDFNYSMDEPDARDVYGTLLTNYMACISWPGGGGQPERILKTTYSSTPTVFARLVSAYDNIFILRPHAGFRPSLVPSRSGAVDFMVDDWAAQSLVTLPAGGIGWIPVFRENYRKQFTRQGISDHLPVWTEFIVDVVPGGSRIAPTADGRDNLYHAVLGALVSGYYTDSFAQGHREQFARWIFQLRTSFPKADRLELRATLLRGLLDYSLLAFSLDRFFELLRELRDDSDLDPFQNSRWSQPDRKIFADIFGNYCEAVSRGDLDLSWSELTLLAQASGISVTAWHRTEAGYQGDQMNPGQASQVHVFCDGRTFFRWEQ
jgi:hypothetical protein